MALTNSGGDSMAQSLGGSMQLATAETGLIQTTVDARIVNAVFFDPEGEKQNV